MTERLLALPVGYDPTSQAIVGMMAAGLDDQSRRLRETVAGLQVEHLEWQEHPGRNTIGMLMAHLAASEIGYLYGACAGLSFQDATAVIHEHLGIDWDGALAGNHAAALQGRNLEVYLDLPRRATHALLQTWDDGSLERTVGTPNRLTFSYRWLLYYLLAHFAAHFGQICSLLHCMRDRAVPGLPEKRIVF